jgi:DNA-binding response OmpR family regulator
VSESPRCATSHTLALRESGVPCAIAPYDEHELLELLRAVPRIEVVLLDAPRNEGECAPVIRRLKRAAPHLFVVCLASNDPTTHANLLRAGAVTVLSKPASMREVEKVTRKLLALRDQHSVANG